MKRIFLTVLTLVILAVFLFPAEAGQSREEDAAKIDQLFLSWSKPDQPGAAVAVVRDGKPWIAKGFGMADLGRAIPIGPRTPLNIASLAKSFTAFAVLRLQEDGRLALDDEVRKHLPEFPDFGPRLTLRHLLFHTSGLRDWGELRRIAGESPDVPVTVPLVLKLVSGQRELNFAPGMEFAYCNAGYVLLAEIVSRASGRSFKDYLKTTVFSPLKMPAAFVRDDPGALPEGTALSYRRSREGRFEPVPDYEAAPGPGSLFLSAEDLGLWLAAVDSGTIVPENIRTQMRNPGKTSDGRDIPYAAGWIPDQTGGFPSLTHSGRWAGYQAYMIWIPERRFAAAVLINHSQADSSALCRRIAEIGLADAKPVAVAPPAPASSTGASLGAFAGRYWLGGEQLISVSEKDGRLLARFSGDIPREWAAESADTFVQPFLGARLRFFSAPGGRADRLTFMRLAETYAAERIPDESWTPADATEFCGRFKSPELAAEIEVKLGEKGLSLVYPRGSDLVLVPVAKDRFAGKDSMAKIVFARDAAGKVIEFRISYLGARNVRFTRS